MEDMKVFLPIFAILISVIGLLYQHFGVIMKLKDDISQTKIDIAEIKTKTELFWRCVENNVINMLKSYPTDIDKDILLDKLHDKSLNLEEICRLRTILKEGLKDAGDRAFAYVMILSRLDILIHDLKGRKNG